MKSLKTKLLAILSPCLQYDFDDSYCEISYRAYRKPCYVIRFGCEYWSPNLGLKTLVKLSKLFGTEEIDVDDYAQRGCESCDWGSDYGHEIQIYNPTVNEEELKKLVDKKFDVKKEQE